MKEAITIPSGGYQFRLPTRCEKGHFRWKYLLLKFGKLRTAWGEGNCTCHYETALTPVGLEDIGTNIDDKEGKQIYVGDIIEFSFHDESIPDQNWGGTALVTECMNGGAGLGFTLIKGVAVATLEYEQIEEFWEDPVLWTIKIIGNHQETPHLLPPV